MNKAYKGFIRKELPSGEVVGIGMNDFEYHENSTYHTDGEIKKCKNGFHSYSKKRDVFKFYTDNLFSEVTLDGVTIYDDMFVSENITTGKWLTLEEFINGDIELMKEAIRYNPTCIKFISNIPQEIIDYQKARILEIETLAKKFTNGIVTRIVENYSSPSKDEDAKCLKIDSTMENEISSYATECVMAGKVNVTFQDEMHSHLKKIISPLKAWTDNDRQMEELEKSFCKLFNKVLMDTKKYSETNDYSH